MTPTLLPANAEQDWGSGRGGKHGKAALNPSSDKSGHRAWVLLLPSGRVREVPQLRLFIQRPRAVLHITQDMGGEVRGGNGCATLEDLSAFALEHIIGVSAQESKREGQLLKSGPVRVIVGAIS